MVHTKKKLNISPGRLITLGFLMLILVGTALLSLPFASADGKSIPLTDALFTSTSAVCVTGLVVFDTGVALSVFGQSVVAVLIQLGGSVLLPLALALFLC